MDQHAFIAKVLAKTGWTQSDLAARAGLDPSTLSRFLSKGREGHALRASTIQRIATASGFAFDSEIVAEISGFSESEAKPFEFVTQERRAVAIKLLCDQQDSSDAWILKSRALESIGHLPGDILIVGLNTTPHHIWAILFAPKSMIGPKVVLKLFFAFTNHLHLLQQPMTQTF